MKRICSVALVVLLVAIFSSKYSVEGRYLLTVTPSGQAVRDFQISKEMKEEPLRGEKDSFRRVPRSGSNPTPASSSRHLSSSSEMSYSDSSASPSLTVTLDSINNKVLTYEYAVRGEIVNIGQ